jgi:uncharacterized repeat protein (TIGR02543 family)
MRVGDSTLPLIATSGSGLTVTVTSLTPAVCTVVARAAHAVAAGTCTLRATQAGSAYVLPALAVTRSLTVAPAQFTVTYNANGGAVVPPSAVYTSGDVGLTLPDPTQNNYVFAGWFTSALGGAQVTTPYVPSGPTTLYAQWIATHSVVTYDLNYVGSADPTTANFTYPTSLSLPSAVRAHYTFTGWYDDPSAGALVGAADASYLPSGDVTLYAHWAGEQFVVTYDLNYGGAPTAGTATFTYPTPLTLPNETRAHYVFSGWYDTPADGTLQGVAADSYSPSAATRLYAHWTAEQFDVTYDLNYPGAPAPTVDRYTYPNPLTLPDASRSEWTFQGWYTDPVAGSFRGLAGAEFSPSADTILFAHWIETPPIG